MKNVVKVTALSLGLALASGFAAADENIAFINAGYLFQNHPDRQAVADKLDAEFKPMADKLAASKKEIDDKIVASRKKVEAKVAALQKDAPRLRQAEIQKRQEEITKFGSDEEAALNKLMEEQDKKVAEFQELNEKICTNNILLRYSYKKKKKHSGFVLFPPFPSLLRLILSSSSFSTPSFSCFFFLPAFLH